MVDYVFPNAETQWASVPSGSSASDPFPSVVFSALKHNKSANPQAKNTVVKTQNGSWESSSICNIFASFVTLDFIHSQGIPHQLDVDNWDLYKVCFEEGVVSDVKFQVPESVEKAYPVDDTSLTATSNCDRSKITSYDFSRVGSEQEVCKISEEYNPNDIVEAKYCAYNNINKPFDHGYISPPEWCTEVSSVLQTTGFSGCRTENVGKESLQVVFGTKYEIVISCKYLPVQDIGVPGYSCHGYPFSPIGYASGLTTTFECRSLTIEYDCSRPCNLFINATVPPLVYGRFNSMVMMPVFPEYGRISG